MRKPPILPIYARWPCLLGQIVGRLDAGRCDEAQVTFTVLLETVGQVASLCGRGHTPNDLGPKLVTGVLQMNLEVFLGVFVTAMDDGKQGAQTLQDTLAVGLVSRVRMLDEKTDVT
jgi:hypothetical protein